MATYYVRADGTVTAANKANATSPNAAATSLNLAEYKLCTFAAGDFIYFSSQGGDYTTSNFTFFSGGEVGNSITYTNVPGEFPNAVVPNGVLRLIHISGANINVSNFTASTVTTNAFPIGIAFTGACSNINVSNITVDISGATHDSKYGLTSSGDLSNTSISNLNLSGHTAQGIYIYGAGSNDVTITNCSVTGGDNAVDLRNIAGVTISNLSITNATSYGFYATALSGLVTIDNITFTGTKPKFYLQSSNLTAGSKISNTSSTSATDSAAFQLVTVNNFKFDTCIATSAAGYGFSVTGDTTSGIDFADCQAISSGSIGFYLSGAALNDVTFTNCLAQSNTSAGFAIASGCYDVDYTNCQSLSNTGDGFSATNTAYNIDYINCIARGNGNKLNNFDGDGFTSHLTNYNLTYTDCLAELNTAAGFAMVGNSSGTLTRCKAFNNAGNWSLEGGGKVDQIRGGFHFNCDGVNPTSGVSWTTRYCMGLNNYPREVNVSAAIKDLVDLDYNQYLALDITKFASIDGGTNDISWETYHVTDGYEPHSIYGINTPIGLNLGLSSGNRPPAWRRRR